MKRTGILLLALVIFFTAAFPLAAEKTTVRISGWPGNPDEESCIKMMVEAFNAKNADIEMIWEPVPGNFPEALKTRLSGGTAADLFYLDVSVFEEFARSNSLLPLDAYLKDGTDFSLKDIPQPLLDGFTFNSRIYGIAKDFSTLSVLFNKAIFDKYKVPYPKNGMTYTEFYATLGALKKAGVEYPVIVNADLNRMIPFVLAAGGQIVDKNLRVAMNEPKARTAIQKYVDLVLKDKVGFEASTVGSGWEGEAFGQGKVAMIMSGPWCLGFLKGSFPEVYKTMGVVEMPKAEKQATMIYTVSWSINKATKNRAAAVTALKFLVTEGQRIFVAKAGVLGSNKKIAAEDKDPIKIPFYKGADYGTTWRIPTPSGFFSKANDEINSRLKDAFYGKITVPEMLKQIDAGYDSWTE